MAASRERSGYSPSVRLKVLRWAGVLDAGAGSLVVLWRVAGSGACVAEAAGISSAGRPSAVGRRSLRDIRAGRVRRLERSVGLQVRRDDARE
eukprot:2605543-Pleurochrysis_carterae.AAC.2